MLPTTVPLWGTIVVGLIILACIGGMLFTFVNKRRMRRLNQRTGSHKPERPRPADLTASRGTDPNKGRPNQGLGA